MVRGTVFPRLIQLRLQSTRAHAAMTLWAGLLALGSFYLPSLPALSGSGMPAAFVPDHSGGSATALHRFPDVPFWGAHSLYYRGYSVQYTPECQANNVRALIAPYKVGQIEPDIVIMHIAMPLLGGIEATRQIKRTHRRTKMWVMPKCTGAVIFCQICATS